MNEKEGEGWSVKSISRNGDPDTDDSQWEKLQADICGSPSEYVDTGTGSSKVGELKILNYKRLCPSVCLSVCHIMLPDNCWFKYLNTSSQCSDTDFNI